MLDSGNYYYICVAENTLVRITICFRHQLSERGQLIRSSIVTGQSMIEKNDAKPDFIECLKALEFEWQQLMERSDEWFDDVKRMMENVKLLEDNANDLHQL